MLTTSNQNGIHEDLSKIVNKHLLSDYRKPVAEHSKRAFDQLFNQLQLVNSSLILDSGCGTGLSCKFLSKKYPNHHIVGVDKSEYRLNKTTNDVDNISYCRCDLVDFWILTQKAKLNIHAHYILYPNPWPKKKHIMRRWHAHPIFPEILKLGESLSVRSDWDLYINEFELALKIAGINNIKKSKLEAVNAISAFEQKYMTQGRNLFELETILK